ncbi:amylo-alpha-1,6-glucosidase [Alienimonas sp. DA493]|uniref:amylo-alpha-1,6-glucosidase n=1 Tax=Alienimonas sp. DA493 TaxID=3373605 RepID=UPI0037550F02
MTAPPSDRTPPPQAAPEGVDLPDLVRRAKALLRDNRRGDRTIPAAGLYPHQWSWDSALIAIGLSHYDVPAAKQELRTLFQGQWANGLLPHIVFSEGDDGYFPGPDWWDSARSPHAPRKADGTPIKTSGLVQPPVHATAVLQVADRDPDPAAAAVWLREMHPKLAAWHDYLYRERDVDGNGLVYIRHPWESGMDNSPLWDEPLSRIDVPEDLLPDYKRSDREHADPDSRPDDATYDRYVLLVELAKACDYDEDRLRSGGGPDGGAFPFRVEDVLFNSLLARAEQDLAEIARRVGADDADHRRRAETTRAYLNKNLWCSKSSMYRNYDLAADEPFVRRVAGGFAPLFAGIPDRARVEPMRKAMRSASFNACADGCADGVGYAVASFDRDHPDYNADGYWRGPVWMNVDWLLHAGLRRYGMAGEESVVRDSMLRLPAKSGFREHYDAETGEGGGAENFSWSAALLIDLAATEFGLDVRAV